MATLISLFFINFIGEAWILFKEYFKNEKLSEFFCDQALYLGVTVVIAFACLWGCEEVGLPCGGVGLANIAQSKMFALAGLAARLLLCTVIVVVGYYLAYRWTERYRDAKEWLWSRFKAVKR